LDSDRIKERIAGPSVFVLDDPIAEPTSGSRSAPPDRAFVRARSRLGLLAYHRYVARKPRNFQWLGFTVEQVKLLDFIDFLGNNGWDRNGQTEAIMPSVLADIEATGMTMAQVKDAMSSIGYSKDDEHQLDRWESKRRTGKFGR
jgi:hypothetical protein